MNAQQNNTPFNQRTIPPTRRAFMDLAGAPSAPPFRNPAFTTPQKRVDEILLSECSGAESSPAQTDTSEIVPETPDFDDDLGKMTITPFTAGKTLFRDRSMPRSHAPGRGEIARPNRDKVRKRKRGLSDRDVGSVRSRLHYASDGSDSEYEKSSKARGPKNTRQSRGWLSGFLGAVSEHPSAPAVISTWLQLAVNFVLMGLILFGLFSVFSGIRSDLAHANEKARAALAQEMAVCNENWIKNQCSPETRVPAIAEACREWEKCMQQDPDAIMKTSVTIRNLGAVINDFTDVVTLKSWVGLGHQPTRVAAPANHFQMFIASLVLVVMVGTNLGFGFLRDSTLSQHTARPAEPSQPAAPPLMGAAHQNPNQAYIWAPIGETPLRGRRNFLMDDATDTDNSPGMKAIMPPPQTPSARRSPTKGERGRSPSKIY